MHCDFLLGMSVIAVFAAVRKDQAPGGDCRDFSKCPSAAPRHISVATKPSSARLELSSCLKEQAVHAAPANLTRVSFEH